MPPRSPAIRSCMAWRSLTPGTSSSAAFCGGAGPWDDTWKRERRTRATRALRRRGRPRAHPLAGLIVAALRGGAPRAVPSPDRVLARGAAGGSAARPATGGRPSGSTGAKVHAITQPSRRPAFGRPSRDRRRRGSLPPGCEVWFRTLACSRMKSLTFVDSSASAWLVSSIVSGGGGMAVAAGRSGAVVCARNLDSVPSAGWTC